METDGETEAGTPHAHAATAGWGPRAAPGALGALTTLSQPPPESPGWFPGVVMLPHRSQPLSTQVGLQAHQEAHPLDGAQPRLAPQQRPPGRRLLRLQVPVRSSGGG